MTKRLDGIVYCIVAGGREVIIPSDSSKFGEIPVSHHCSSGDVDHVITDSGPYGEYRAALSSRVDLVLVRTGKRAGYAPQPSLADVVLPVRGRNAGLALEQS